MSLGCTPPSAPPQGLGVRRPRPPPWGGGRGGEIAWGGGWGVVLCGGIYGIETEYFFVLNGIEDVELHVHVQTYACVGPTHVYVHM